MPAEAPRNEKEYGLRLEPLTSAVTPKKRLKLKVPCPSHPLKPLPPLRRYEYPPNKVARGAFSLPADIAPPPWASSVTEKHETMKNKIPNLCILSLLDESVITSRCDARRKREII